MQTTMTEALTNFASLLDKAVNEVADYLQFRDIAGPADDVFTQQEFGYAKGLADAVELASGGAVTADDVFAQGGKRYEVRQDS